MDTIDVFGSTGFIGKAFSNMYPDEIHEHSRDDDNPLYKNILYFISTTDNYNVHNYPTKDIETNLIKLIRVLENCKNTNTVFNFISSWFVYGNVVLPAKENSNCQPTGFYSITKKCAEDLLISYCKTFDIKYRILRLGNVYGKNDKGVSKKKNALQYLINEIKNNKDINLYHGGDFIRDYIHVDDVCRAIYTVLSNNMIYNDIINIGSGIPYKFINLMNFVKKQTNSTSKFITIEPTNFHKLVQVKDMYLNIDKLNSLGYSPKVDIYTGLKQLL
jgi:nucleoside-diphosphate-sugar epimerase